jgi:secreted trypsin-like serine protease
MRVSNEELRYKQVTNMKSISIFMLLPLLGGLSASVFSAPKSQQAQTKANNIQSRIVGGIDSSENAWPSMVALVSTFQAVDTSLSVTNTSYPTSPFTNSPAGIVSGELVDCGLAGEVCVDAIDKVCLIQRGDFDFSEKVNNCEAGGGIGAIIFNNEAGEISGTLGDDFSGTIPVVAISQADGDGLATALFSLTATLSVTETATLQQEGSCGGSYLGGKWVLTAAHCVEGNLSNNLKVNIGEYDLSDGAENAVDIVNVFIHPQYETDAVNYDLALVEIAGSVNAPAMLLASKATTDQFAVANSPATVIGWGGTVGYAANDPNGETSDFPDILQEVELQLYSNDECRDIMSNSLGVAPSQTGVTDVMICAGAPQGGQSSCQGDSGGPLMISTSSGWEQIGIVSWGRGCADIGHPGVFSRVAELSDFTDAVTTGIAIVGQSDFPLTPSGLATEARLTLLNNSEQTLSPTITIENASDLTVDDQSCANLEPGATCLATLSFNPNSAISQTASITVDAGLADIPTSGTQITMDAVGAASDAIVASAGAENDAIKWFTGGDANWQANATNGLQSGAIGNLSESYLVATIEGEGTLIFDWSVSSEENTEEPSEPFDALYLIVNGDIQQFISGSVNFTTVSVELAAGTNVVEWTYSKDQNASDGTDQGFVRAVTFTPTATVTPPTPTPTPTPAPTPTGSDSSGGGGTFGWISLGLLGLLIRRIR